MESTQTPAPPPLPPMHPQLSFLPQHVITSGTRKDCIRLRGLPYEASVEHILEFLGEFAKNIVFQGVHMVYNAQGQPSGEAFIQMDSEQSAYSAAQMRHHRYMYFGKKQRYIEVFQCSGEDMSLVLTGGIPASNAPLSPVGKTLLSPGSTIIATTPHFTPAPAGFGSFGPPPALLAPISGTRAPAPTFAPPFAPVLYWACPSPPVSPPHQPALVIMQGTPPPPPYPGHHEVANFIHSVSEWSVDYLTPSHQFSSLSLNTVGMHSAAA